MTTLVSKFYSVEQCRTNFKTLFVFGDNLMRVGMAGQAIIREQENAIGIATKKLPSNTSESFFLDSEYEDNCKLIDEDIQKVKDYAEEKGLVSVCFPFQGLGTGLSAMQTRCPKTFCYLTMRLIDEFEFNNIAALKSK